MNCEKFTQGPWHVSSYPCIGIRTIYTTNDDAITILMYNNPNSDGDANLIAAAPDMYDLLDKASDLIENMVFKKGFSDLEDASELLSEIDNTLKHAGGKK